MNNKNIFDPELRNIATPGDISERAERVISKAREEHMDIINKILKVEDEHSAFEMETDELEELFDVAEHGPERLIGKLLLPPPGTDLSDTFEMGIITNDGVYHTFSVEPERHKGFDYCLNSEDEYTVRIRGGEAVHFSVNDNDNIRRRGRISKLKRAGYGEYLLVLHTLKGECKNFEEADGVCTFDFTTPDNTYKGVLVTKVRDGVDFLPDRRSIPNNIPNLPLKFYCGGTFTLEGYLNAAGEFVVDQGTEVLSDEPCLDEEMMKTFHSLTLKQKQELLCAYESYKAGRDLGCNPEQTALDYKGYLLKYRLIGKFLPEGVRLAVDNCLARNDKNGLKENVLKALLDKLYITPELKCSTEHYMKQLSKSIYGREKEIRELINWLKTPGGGVYAITGSVGTGKRSMVEAVLKATGIANKSLSLGAINDKPTIAGTGRIYDNANTGQLIESIVPGGVTVITGLELMGKGNHGDNPTSALWSMLDDGNIVDSLVQTPISINEIGAKVIVILTDTKTLPKTISKKLNPRNFTEYKLEEKKVICKDYIIPKLVKVPFTADEEVYDILSDQLTLDGGAYDIEYNVEKLARNLKAGTHITRENLFELLDLKRWNVEDIAETPQELRDRFLYLRPLYEKPRDAKICQLFSEMEDAELADIKNKLLAELTTLINVVKGQGFSDIDMEKLQRDMDASHFNMKNVKAALLRNAVIRKRCNAEVKPILVQGPYGAGKTTLASAFAKSVGIPYISINCHDAGQELMNTIADELSKAGTSRVLMVLDELDKMSKHNNPLFRIQSLLDGKLIASDISCPIEVPDIIVVATANDLGNIPPALISRFEIITVDGYTDDEKVMIIRDYTIPAILKAYNAEHLSLDEKAVEEIVSYSDELGVRDAKNNLTSVVAHVLKKGDEEEYTITVADVKDALGAKPIPRGNFPSKAVPGVIKGLAVSGNSGIVTAVTAEENPYSDKDECVGLLGDSTMESVKIAKFLVQKKLNRKLSPLFVSFSEGAVKKDGASAGITLYSAIMSCATGKAVPEDYAFTGEVDQQGNVFAVGVKEKITAAIRNGCTKLFLPRDNYVELCEDKLIHKYKGIELVPVEHIDELDCLFKEGK